MKTILPNGKEAELFPPSYNTTFIEENNFTLKCSPRLGEQNEIVMKQIGLSEDEIKNLQNKNVI